MNKYSKIYYLLSYLLIVNTVSFAQEICNNGIDDDGDGAIDLLDSDCACSPDISAVLSEDFENYIDCPTSFGGYMDLITDWRPAGTPQGANTCGFMGGFPFPAVPQPIPSGEGCYGMGADEGIINCLENCTLLTGDSYTVSFYVAPFSVNSIAEIEFALYGRNNCNNLSDGPSVFDFDFVDNCASNGWTKLIGFTPTADSIGEWELLSGTFTANSDYGALLLGHACGVSAYSYVDQITITGNFGGENCAFTPDWPEIAIDITGDCLGGYTLVADPDEASQYQWYLDGIAIPGATGNPWTANTLSLGEYQVSAIYPDGKCAVSTPVLFEASDLEVLELSINTTDPFCFGETTGSIEPVANSPYTPFEYIWSTGSDTPVLDNIGAGEYAVTITDANGCYGIAEAILIDPAEIQAELLNTSPLCFGDFSGEIELIVNNPDALFVYEWNTGNDQPFITNTGEGSYIVTITNTNGCTATFNTVLTQPSPLLLDTTVLQPTFSEDGSIEVIPFGGITPYGFDWNSGFSESINTDLAIGVYTVTVTDNNGCTAISSFELFDPLAGEAIQDKIYLPNAFSPNGDGVNDYFEIFFYPQDLVNSIRKVKVFDRWGGVVYETLNREPANNRFWDGTVNGEPAQSGVYTYFVQLELYNTEAVLFSGEITMIR